MQEPEYPDIEKLTATRDVDGLIQALRCSETWRQAQQALVEIGPPAIHQLIAALQEREIALAVAEVLKEIGAPAVHPLIEALENRRTAAYAALVLEDIGSLAVEPLIGALASTNLRSRILAVRALGQIGDARAVSPIRSIINNALLDDKQRKLLAVSFEAMEMLAHGGEVSDLDRVSSEEFTEGLRQRGFKVSPRSDRYYYSSDAPDVRIVVQKRSVRLERRCADRRGQRKWKLMHSFSGGQELHHVLIAVDAL